MSVVLETTIGDLTIDLFTEERPHCKYLSISLPQIKLYSRINYSIIFNLIQIN